MDTGPIRHTGCSKYGSITSHPDNPDPHISTLSYFPVRRKVRRQLHRANLAHRLRRRDVAYHYPSSTNAITFSNEMADSAIAGALPKNSARPQGWRWARQAERVRIA